MNGADLKELYTQALHLDKEPLYVIRFEEAGIEVTCTIRKV